MKTINFIFILILFLLSVDNSIIFAQTKNIDIIGEISKNPELVKKIGLQKLNDNEKKNLNVLLNDILNIGLQNSNNSKSDTEDSNDKSKKNFGSSHIRSSNIAYKSKIDSDNDDVLKLENGAVVEIISGYLGYVGYRKDVVLYKIGNQWKIWIEGKKAFKCVVYKNPDYGSKYSIEELTIFEVKGDGKILVMSDGSIFEVNDLYTINTCLWLGFSDILLINGYELINLDEGDEIIEVMKIK